MGEMQLVLGAMIFAFWIASCSAAASSRAALVGDDFSDSFAALQISSATFGPTREKSSCRKPESVRASVSFIIPIKRPSSTPCGCGLISSTAGGNSFVLRSYTTTPPCGSR